jgi:Zn-dependent protease/predicted transcriptional regulator
MKWSFQIARVSGIDIKIHATFFLILLLGAVQWGGPNGLAGAFFGVLLMALLFFCVVLHELGHSLVAQYFRYPVRQIVLLPIGGVAQMEKNPEKPLHELLITVAGPLVNVVIAVVLAMVAGASGHLDSLDAKGLVDGQLSAPSVSTLLAWLLAANVSLAVFNMIPAFPLDGGRVLRAILWLYLGFTKATRIASGVGQFLALAFGIFGVLGGHFILVLIALFIFLGAGQEWAEERARTVLTTLNVGDAYNRHALTLAPGDQVSTVVHYLLTSYQPDFAVLQGSTLLGVVTRDDVLKSLATETGDSYVTGIMQRDVPRFQESVQLDEVRKAMQEQGARVAAVCKEDKYLGLVSLEDINEALMVATFIKQQEERRLAEARSG